MTIFDQIREDVEKGTPGPWEYNDPKKYTQGHGKFSETAVYMPGVAYYWRAVEIQGPDDETEISNAARIVRVPQLERIALAAEELAKVFPDIVGYLEGLIEDGCPKCGGDCSGANPPVSYCPMKSMNNDLARANAAIAKLREATA